MIFSLSLSLQVPSTIRLSCTYTLGWWGTTHWNFGWGFQVLMFFVRVLVVTIEMCYYKFIWFHKLSYMCLYWYSILNIVSCFVLSILKKNFWFLLLWKLEKFLCNLYSRIAPHVTHWSLGWMSLPTLRMWRTRCNSRDLEKQISRDK